MCTDMRITKHYWYCGLCRTQNAAGVFKCPNCGSNHHEKNAQVHSSERAVIYYNPLTGEHRTPARSDQPIPEQYAKDGFERREIMNMTAWEKEAGVVHEATNFNPGNEGSFTDPRDSAVGVPPEVKAALIEDMRSAIASGPWTGQDKIL